MNQSYIRIEPKIITPGNHAQIQYAPAITVLLVIKFFGIQGTGRATMLFFNIKLRAKINRKGLFFQFLPLLPALLL